jgi:hypothetical protein
MANPVKDIASVSFYNIGNVIVIYRVRLNPPLGGALPEYNVLNVRDKKNRWGKLLVHP